MMFKKNKTNAVEHYTHLNKKGVLYHLNSKYVTLAQGRQQLIYYFTNDVRDTACSLPEGWKVNENKVNGFLTVSRSSDE